MSQNEAEDKFAELIAQGKKLTSKKKGPKKGRPVGRRKRTYSGNGYTYIFVKGKQVLEHRYLMAQHLGRELRDHEAVYFKNKDKTDLSISNLQLGIKPGKHTSVICPHCDKDIFHAPNS